jgi:hypothetical protein
MIGMPYFLIARPTTPDAARAGSVKKEMAGRMPGHDVQLIREPERA